MKTARKLVMIFVALLAGAECFSQSVVWNGNGDGTSWSNPQNWVGQQVPVATNNVIITSGAGANVVISSAVSVESIQCTKAFTISNSLTVTAGPSSVVGILTVADGASLSASGSNTTFTSSGLVVIDDASLYVSEGATLSLPGLVNYNDGSGTSPNWQASGPGSVLALTGLTNVVGPFSYYSRNALLIQALAGGEVSLGGVDSISNGVVQVEADGTGSEVDLSALQEFNGSTEDSAYSQLQPSNGGTILTKEIETLTGVTAVLGGGTLNLDTVTNLSGTTLTVTNGAVTLANVVDIDDASLYVTNAATLSLPGVANCNDDSGPYPEWQAGGSGSLLALAGLTNVVGPFSYYSNEGLLIQALAGGEVSLAGLVSIPSGVVQVEAGGAGSQIDLSSLQEFNGSTEGGAYSQLQPGNGGTVLTKQLGTLNGVTVVLGSGTLNLSAVTNLSGTTLTVTNGAVTLANVVDIDNASLYVSDGATLSLPGVINCDDGSGAYPVWQASGSGSLLSLTGLTNVAGPLSYYSGDALLIQALAGGKISLGGLVSVSSGVVQVNANGSGSEVDLSAMREFDGSDEGGASSQLQAGSGGTVLAGKLGSLNGVTASLGGTGTLNLTAVTNLSGTTLTVTNGAVTLPNVTEIDNANLYVSGGATLSLPGVADCDNSSGAYSVWQASGSGSVLALTSLTNVVGPFSYYSNEGLLIQALAGGEVNLGELNSVSNGVVQIQSSGVGSEVDLSAMREFEGSDESGASSQLQPASGGTILTGQLGILTGVTAVMGGGTVNLDTVTNLSGTTLTVTNGAVTLTNVTDIENTSLYVSSGAALSLPGVVDCDESSGNYPVWQASGSGSVLDLNSLTNVVGPYSYYSSEALQIQAQGGGEIVLLGLKSIPNGVVQVQSSGGGSQVVLSALQEFDGSIEDSASSQLQPSNGGAVQTGQLGSLTGVNVTLGGGTLNLNTVTNLNSSTLNATNGTVTLANVTDIDNASFYVTNAAKLSLPGVVNCNDGGSSYPVWQAGGEGSVLNLTSLTNLVAPYVQYSTDAIAIQALDGGEINLGALISIPSGFAQVEASGSGSAVNLSQLVNYVPANTTLTTLDGGTIPVPQFVDLSVANLTVPPTAVLGQPVTVTFTITNLTSVSAAGPWQNQFLLATNPSGTNAQSLGTVLFTNSITGRGSDSVTQSLILPAGVLGAVYLGVTVNSSDSLPETTLTNNTVFSPTPTIVTAADLSLTGLTAPGAAQFGQTVAISFSVTNIGTAPATAAWIDQVYLSESPTSLIGATLLTTIAGTSPLAPGAGYTRNQNVTLPLSSQSSPGAYNIIAMTDAADALIESTKANNVRSIPITLTRPGLPDLAVPEVTAPATAAPGSTVTLTWTVTNQGALNITNGAWSEAVGISNVNGAVSTLADFRFTNSLNVGGVLNRTEAVTLLNGTPAGDDVFFVTVNNLGDIIEINPSNNTTFATNLTIIPAALSFVMPVTSVNENTASPDLACLVSRNGNLSSPVVVSLASSATSHLVVPATVTIPSGESSAIFTATVLDDGIVDSNALVAISAQASGYLSATTQVLVINTDVPQLSLYLSSSQISEGQTASATVTSDVISAQPVVVSVSSSSPAALAVPSTVTIPANSNSVSFTLTASQNTVIAPAQTYTVTASAPGIVSASSNLTVLNVNTPTLTLSLDRTNISEADGPLAAIATVSRLPATDQPLTVALTSTNPTAARVPSQIIIPPYQGTASFYVAAVVDTKATGSNVTQIAAQALDIASNAVGTAATAELTVQNTNGPLLSVVIAQKVVAKGLNPATTAVVSRNTPSTSNLVVTLTCSAPTEATTPGQVTIPAGQTNVSFEIASLDDGILGTSQSVSITASATNYASGSDVFAVTDLELPDLVINNVSAPGAVITGENATISFNLENQGLASLTNEVTQNIYLTTDPSSGNNLLVGSVAFPGPLAPGQKVALSVLVPASSLPPPGTYWVLVTANSGATAAESNPANDTGISPEPLIVNIDYTAQVQAGLTTVPAGTPVPLFGTATLTAGGPATNVQVNLIITVQGLPRTLSIYTDTNGNFSTTFTPLATEAGTYTVTAVAPGITSGPTQAEFNILGITANPASLAMETVVGTNASAAVSLQNTSDIPLTGLTATVSGLAANLTANVILSTNSVAAQSGLTLDCTIEAASSSIPQSSFNIHIISAEGAVLDVPVAVTVAPPSPLLVTSPAQLRSSMLSGGQTVVQFSVANLGGVASGPLIIALPNVPWINIASPSPLPSLNPGQSNLVTLVLTPGTNLALGPYGGQLAINGSGLGIQEPFTFNNVSDANGSLLVQSVDELTFFAVGEPPLTNASVTVIDPLTQGVVASGATDSNGFFSVPVIIAGSYQVNVTAPQHSPLQGTAVITPGETNNFQAFLSLETVSFSWSVVPTQIQAQAQVTIQATYVANVPAPVIVPSPTSLDFSSLTQPGQFMDVPITLANYGLIAVDNVTLSIDSGPYYKIDALATSLGTLAAQGSITVPVRVTLLTLPPSPNSVAPRKDDDASDCISIGISWGYPCGGYLVGKGVSLPVFNAVGECNSPATPDNSTIIYGGPIYGSGGQIDLIPAGQIVPETCDSDPCVDKRLQAMANCAFSFIKIPIPKAIKCFNSAYKCGTGLVGSCGGGTNGAKCGLVIAKCLYSGIGCSGSLGAALAQNISWIGKGLTILGCSYDICTACQSLGYSGVCGSAPPGSGGGGGGPKKRFDVAVGADADVIFGPLFAQANGIEAEIAPDLYFFNDDTWFSVTDTNSLTTLLNQFDSDIQSNSDGGLFVTAAERTNLLALPLPAPLAASDLEALIDRWNLTMSNYTAGIFDVSQAPPGADTNFIDFDYWISLNGAAATALQTYEDLGFEDAADAWLSTRNALLAQYENGQTGVCAEIVLQIDQTAVLTLNAFNATLQLNNSGVNSLSNVMANIVVKNQAGQDVTSLFAIAPPTLGGALTAVDGTGSLIPGASGSAEWTLVPTEAAAPEAPTNYLVSGSLSYTLGAATVTIPLAPTTINVQPDPQIYLKYFLQRDVFGDNPYTPQIEPSVPFPMAVMVQNQGYGTADNFQITSAQPQIVDNEKGLLIGFDIIGAQVGLQPVEPSLTVNFGDILPQQTEVGIWYMTCTLDGQFIGYQASYQNITSLGNTQLSVIDGVETHLMTHMVRADGAWDDGLPDFLVDDIPNLANLPDTLYLSGGGIQPVSVVQSASVSSPVSPGNLQVQLTANFPAGFSFVLVPDPANGQLPLQSVLYSNGTNFLTNNFWITDRTFQGIGFAPLLQTNLQLFVYHTNAGPDTFTLQYTLPPVISNTNAPISSVFALPAQSPPAFGVVWSGATDAGAAALAYFDIYSSDNGGTFLLWQSQVTNNSAIFNGTPGHTYSFYSVATDVAGHREVTPLQPQAQTIVALNTNSPSISIVPSVSLNAGQTLSLSVTASDPNPLAVLSFTLGPGAPVGVVVNPVTGQISWATSPTFGGTTNVISVVVTDNGQPQLSATGMVAVILLQTVNPPTLAPVANYTIAESSLLTFTNSATDNNLPPRPLTFSLGAGAPTNATIDPVTGIFQWRPTAAQAPSTNIISVIVTDNGTPPLSATQQFTVVVNPVTFEFVLSFGYTNLFVGETNSVPITLTSQLPLTNITAILQASASSLTNLILIPVSPEVMEAFLQPLGESQYGVSFTLNPALSPGTTRTLAQLAFASVPEVHSSIDPLVVSQPAGMQPGGVPVAKPGAANGRIIIVGLEPVLDALLGTNPVPTLTIYGNLGSNYQLDFTTNLALTNWQSAGSILITNQQQNFNVNQSLPEIYYRAQ